MEQEAANEIDSLEVAHAANRLDKVRLRASLIDDKRGTLERGNSPISR